jgi:hypothetical protein
MKSLKSNLIILGSVGLLFLGACNKGAQASYTKSSPASPPVQSQPASSAPPPGSRGVDLNSDMDFGGYHFEFGSEKKATGTLLYLYLQKKDKKEPVPNAKVMAQVQLPNGKQQTLPLNYDAKGKRYAVVFPSKQPGQYPVNMTVNINGLKVESTIIFNQ